MKETRCFETTIFPSYKTSCCNGKHSSYHNCENLKSRTACKEIWKDFRFFEKVTNPYEQNTEGRYEWTQTVNVVWVSAASRHN